MLLGIKFQRDAEVNHQHAARHKPYIGMSAAAMAAAFEVDCTPMEGFDPRRWTDRGPARTGSRVAILPLGYREADKELAGQPDQVRRPCAVRHQSLIFAHWVDFLQRKKRKGRTFVELVRPSSGGARAGIEPAPLPSFSTIPPASGDSEPLGAIRSCRDR